MLYVRWTWCVLTCPKPTRDQRVALVSAHAVRRSWSQKHLYPPTTSSPICTPAKRQLTTNFPLSLDCTPLVMRSAPSGSKRWSSFHDAIHSAIKQTTHQWTCVPNSFDFSVYSKLTLTCHLIDTKTSRSVSPYGAKKNQRRR